MVVSLVAVGAFVFINQNKNDDSESSDTSVLSQGDTSNTNVNKLTTEEFEKHNTKEDCYVMYEEGAYDVTDYIEKHPGGAEAIIKYCGKDITNIFDKIDAHSDVNLADWDEYFIGTVE
jgi:cytochrome b involved in lipid metabolism